MGELNLKRCPICDGELDFGTVRFPAKRSVMDSNGQFTSEKEWEQAAENNKGNLLKQLFDTSYIKEFYVSYSSFSGENPAGCCMKCGKIFAEFDLTESSENYVFDENEICDDYEYTEECEAECAEDSVPLIWNSYKGEFVSKNDFSEDSYSEDYNGEDEEQFTEE